MSASGRRPLAALVALATFVGCAAAPDAATPQHEDRGGNFAMGTVLETTLLGPDADALEAERVRVFAEVERLEALLSQWRPQSDVGRLNAAAGGPPLAVDPEVAALLRRCVELHYTTLGSFDVTVGPLVALWTEASRSNALPEPEVIEAARALVGPERLHFDGDGRFGLEAGSYVDLGGVAKGYALDRVRAQLGPQVHAALLSFGQSSVWAIGHPEGLEGWRLLVRGLDPGTEFFGMLTLRDQALSTSESLGQWSEIQGRRYGHILDPRDGQPLAARRTAVVVTGDATLAEALSKAVLVLGEVEGIALVESIPGADALLLVADGRSWRTSRFDLETRFEPLAAPPAAAAPQAPGPTLRSDGAWPNKS